MDVLQRAEQALRLAQHKILGKRGATRAQRPFNILPAQVFADDEILFALGKMIKHGQNHGVAHSCNLPHQQLDIRKIASCHGQRRHQHQPVGLLVARAKDGAAGPLVHCVDDAIAPVDDALG